MALPPWLNDYVKPFDPGPVITAALGLLGAGGGAIFTFWVSKKKAKSDVQATLNASFQLLTNELQEERMVARTLAQEQSKEIHDLKTELAGAMKRIRQLETVMHEHGIAIPN